MKRWMMLALPVSLLSIAGCRPAGEEAETIEVEEPMPAEPAPAPAPAPAPPDTGMMMPDTMMRTMPDTMQM